MSYGVHETTNPYLEKVRSHKEPYSFDFLGKEITIFPDVMSPKYDWSSRFHIENMPNQKGCDFLEIGCGSGVISLFAGLQGANKIVAVDINQNAIKNTKENLDKYGLKSEVFHSDVFSDVKGKFDTITFAAPYHGNEPQDILEFGVSDPNYKALKTFLAEAHKYLKDKGQILLGFSNTGDLDLLHQVIIENKLFVKDIKKETNDGWEARLYILEPIKFTNVKQEYFYDGNLKWFNQFKDEIVGKKVLEVGHGLGYSCYFKSLFAKEMVSLDIEKNEKALCNDKLVIYDGNKFPFKDNEFDVVLCSYTLHHIKGYEAVFREIIRVTNSKIIIIEETYNNFLGKIYIAFNCWLTNKRAGQKVKIYFNSYFSKKSLKNLFTKFNLKVISHSLYKGWPDLEIYIASKHEN